MAATSVGERIREVIIDKRLNMNSFTNKLGLSSNSIIIRVVNDPTRNISMEVAQKIGEVFSVDMNWLILGIGRKYRDSYAAPDDQFINYYRRDGEEPFDRIKITGFEDCDAAFDVHGDVMASKYRPGDIVICKTVTENESLLFGETYRLVVRGKPMLRYLRAIPEAGKLKLGTENNRVDDHIVDLADIEHLYIIKGIIRRESY